MSIGSGIAIAGMWVAVAIAAFAMGEATVVLGIAAMFGTMMIAAANSGD